MNQKEKIIFETVKLEQGKVPDSGAEKIERQTESSVDLDPEILTFLRKYIGINIYPPEVELKKIRDFVKTLPPESQSPVRRILINKFKEKLAETRKSSTKAQVEIEHLVRNNPDMSREELMLQLNQIIYFNQLESQRFEFGTAINKFLDARDKVQSTVERYRAKYGESWQEELFRDLFGGLPKGKIVIEVLPASIYIRIFDIEDYVFAYISAPGNTERLGRSSGGSKFNSKFKNLPELDRKVIIENSSVIVPDYSPQTRSHEEEHTTFEYYNPRLSRNRSVAKNLDASLDLTKGEVEYNAFKGLTDQWALSWVLLWESQAKDEVLAYLKDGRDMYNILRLLEDDNGLYNFFQAYVEEFQHKVTAWIQENKIVIRDKPMTEDEIGNFAHDALFTGWQKYKKDINMALIASAKLLRRYHKSPDDRLKVIRLLSQEPLNKWHRLDKILS